MMILLHLGVGGAAAMLGVAFTDVERVSFGETSYEQSDLVVQTATPVGPGNNVDQIEIVVDNADEPAEKTYDTGRLKWQRDIQGGRVTFESEPNAITADFDREEYEVYDYEKRLPKRFMSEKSSTSVYIGAPEEFAEWIGYSVNELLNGAAETGTDIEQSANTEDASKTDNSGGFISRLFGG
jgi:hypothetical protein